MSKKAASGGPHRKAANVNDVSAGDFIAAYAAHLKKNGKLEVPKWHDLVKTGCQRELAPLDADWFYTRTASIARRLYLRKGLGVDTLAKTYGGASDKGTRPSHFSVSSRNVIRKSVQALEKIGNVEKDSRGRRRISKKGQRDLDAIATNIVNARA